MKQRRVYFLGGLKELDSYTEKIQQKRQSTKQKKIKLYFHILNLIHKSLKNNYCAKRQM